jgi:hypothetical protein
MSRKHKELEGSMSMQGEAEPRLLSAGGQQHLRQIYQAGLLEDTLPFWFPRAIDGEHGGYLHCFDRVGQLFETDKSIWVQGRMSWLLLKLHNEVEPRPEWLEWGLHGLHFLERHGFDRDGRMFFHVAQDGQPIRKRRYAYSEAFAAIAFAAAARATGREEYAVRAKELLRFFLRWNFEPGWMPPKYTAVRPLLGLGPRMIALVTAQELRNQLGPSEEFELVIDRCLGEIRDLFVRPSWKSCWKQLARTAASATTLMAARSTQGMRLKRLGSLWRRGVTVRIGSWSSSVAGCSIGCGVEDGMRSLAGCFTFAICLTSRPRSIGTT